MSDQLRAAAVAAATAARKASRAYLEHRNTCAVCKYNKPCDLCQGLQSATWQASKASQRALLAYLPVGTSVTYHGPRVDMYGEWWINGTDREALEAAYILGGPNGRTLARVEIAHVHMQGEPTPEGDKVLTATRAACVDIVATLALCKVVMPVLVDIDAQGDIAVYFPQADYNAALHEAYKAKGGATGDALERATYVIVLLDVLDEMRMLARVGAVHAIAAKREIAQKYREVLTRQPTKRPRA
ncbi:hypothetical protein ACU635_14220 [[Actinomadura] parvosata]|uniref:hypothetical protein n=1 Tax=[Actinomadura] parvosata TaxID=1955412 RepID=UPI00406C5C9F